ncbi:MULTISPECIES: hypothetical protein [unclassified Leptolyngbya]|uniref:hypothetical protein n=1 Tax=unclassified Leptolyngbya TaxID=2650499 RepID=UPI00168497E5|nr:MULTISPECIES: hypothetical protein [unclassified Leptolyngbya]MBD1909349.1 hypothetical protein [Leptolyngbya sp. FACHB-8]MBD2158117.1 hypothetical protein [Leptolyngbya sp. FACHB-16]
MNSLISFEQFSDWAAARPEPPYFLLFASMLIILTCSLPLIVAVRHRVNYWSKNFSPDTLPRGGGVQVLLPFLGTSAGLCILLASTMEVFGLAILPSLIFALVLTVVISQLAWSQLGKLLSRRLVRSYLDQFSDFPRVGI